MRNPQVKRENLIYSEGTRQYKKQLFWQVIFPISCGAFVFLVIAILLSIPAINNYDVVYKWAIVSLIFLLIPIMIGNLVFLVLFVVGIFGVSKANSALPGFFRQINEFIWIFHTLLTRLLDKIVSPVLTINGWFSAAGRLKKITFRSFRG